ncbi:hypothetical protein BSIN_3352 [Burkholderia singularis]|uniref:Uncharacterized protein n=1 Tax=Burkholderia singularis TaxID=1503053 RepID=A0A238H5I1_9BURK|nr:hypothetical protein BSIN_3352 [Burkholderia singularis]
MRPSCPAGGPTRAVIDAKRAECGRRRGHGALTAHWQRDDVRRATP